MNQNLFKSGLTFLLMTFGIMVSYGQTVMNSLDMGPGSLRQVVMDAMPGAVITFDVATNGVPIVLADEILIDKALTFIGNDTSNTTISGPVTVVPTGRIFNIANATEVNIAGITFTNGNAEDNGGAILIDNTNVSIDSSRFVNNIAGGNAGTQGGGAIYNFAGTADTLTINNSMLSNNMANGMSGSGGAIFNEGTLVVTNSTIMNNSSNRAGGGIESRAGSTTNLIDVTLNENATATNPGNGGGLHITGAGDATILRGTVNGNTAGNEGGGLWNGAGLMTIDSTTIDGNIASGVDANAGGGGIYSLRGSLDIEDAFISNNIADGTAGSGGGILVDDSTMMVVNRTIISGNSSNRAGGGVEVRPGANVRILTCNIDNNNTGAAPGNGGGLHVTGNAFVELVAGTVSGNTAAAEGGGLWNGSGNMIVNHVDVMNNVASGDEANQGGGGIYNLSGNLSVINSCYVNLNVADGIAGSGGGILNDSSGVLTVRNSYINGNDASRAGGGIETRENTTVNMLIGSLINNTTGDAPGNGGGLHVTGNGNVSITRFVISQNYAKSEGGGVWNGSGTMTLNNNLMERNIANGDDASNGGGAVYNLSGTVNLIGNNRLRDNVANGDAGSGGAILNDEGATLSVNGATITGNTSNRAGGGIEARAGSFTILRNVNLNNNSTGPAPGNGGGFHITGNGNAEVLTCNVNGNTAAREGGGLWNGSGRMNVVNCNVMNNTASGDAIDDGGGGVFNNGGRLVLNRVALSRNTVDGMSGNGGGLHNHGNGVVTLTKTTVSLNESANEGGGIYNNGRLRISGATVAANIAEVSGGGLSQNVDTTRTSIFTSIIASNTSGGVGVDIATTNGALTSSGYNLIGQDDAGVYTADMTDLIGTPNIPLDPMLDTLANNGGFTMTHALLCGSPAIDAGVPNNNSLDQIFMGVFGGQRDIGAFELQEDCGANEPQFANTTVQGNTLTAEANKLYPNPSTNGLVNMLIQPEFGENVNIRVINASGQIVKSMNTSYGNIEIDLGNLNNGTYVVQLIAGEIHETHRLVLMK